MASGDRFVSFKAGGDRRDDNFFFYRAFPFLARPLNSVGGGIDRMGWQTDEPMQLSHQNGVHTLFFLVVGDINIGVYKYMKIHVTLMSIYQNSDMYIYTKKFIALIKSILLTMKI